MSHYDVKRELLFDVIDCVVGSVLYAVGLVCMLAPNGIAPGGISGLSTILNYKFPFLSIGLMTVVLNIPILILGLVNLGKKFIIKTIISTVAVSVATAVLESVPNLFKYTGDTLLAAIFGGCVFGAGIGIIFIRGFTTGGTDVIVRVVKKRHPQFTVGTLSLAIDLVVITLAGIIYGNIENSLYALVAIFVSTKMMDLFLNGLDSAKLVYIISEKSEEIGNYITREVARGITVLHGKGFYSGIERDVLMVAIRPQQLFRIRSVIKEIDPKAFMIFSNATEVLGNGFKVDLNK